MDKRKGKAPNAIKVTRLSNAHHYFLSEAVIIEEEYEDYNYRLITRHGPKLLTDHRYKTTRGAKIAFHKMFKNNRWKESTKPFWPEFYAADGTWVDASKIGRSEDGRMGSTEGMNE